MSSHVQHRLATFSEAPPPSAWAAIAAALDEPNNFANSLRQFEETPPAAVWKGIETHLDATPARVVPMRTKLFKFAIAATILVAVAASSIFYLTHSSGPSLAANQQEKTKNSEKQHQAANSTQAQSGSNTQQNEAANTFSAIAENTIAHFAPQVQISKLQSPAVRTLHVKPEAKSVINTDLANRYMIATTQGGAVVRLPKKAYSDYACAETAVNTNCKEKIATIQSKMAASVSTDFTDFIYLLQNLQEN